MVCPEYYPKLCDFVPTPALLSAYPGHAEQPPQHLCHLRAVDGAAPVPDVGSSSKLVIQMFFQL